MRLLPLTFLTLSIFLLPGLVFAAECFDDGVTVVYINGINTTETEAKTETKEIEKTFHAFQNHSNLTFKTAYNPPHIGGLGDMAQSITQAYGKNISTFDRDTMLNQLHNELKTQQVLLVGYSQGSFYANELYEYLVSHGMPENAVGVYHVATPASFVAKDGKYMTSSTDKVINAARDYGYIDYPIIGQANDPLPANVTIKLTDEEKEDPYGGHSLSDVYLNRGGVGITNSMKKALTSLSSSEVSDEVASTGGCFIPPGYDVSYFAKQATFAIADPLGALGTGLLSGLYQGTKQASTLVWNTATNILPPLKLLEQTDEREKLAASFSVVRDVYGSSIDDETLRYDLLGIEPPAEDTHPSIVYLDTSFEDAEEVPDTAQVYTATEEEREEAPVLVVEKSVVPEPIHTPGNIQPLTFGGGGVGGGGSSSSRDTDTESFARETPADPVPAPDTTPPEVMLSIAQCGENVFVDTCVLTSATDLDISWSVVADDLDYVTYQDIRTEDVTATDTISNNETKTYTVVAYDTVGNSITKTITVHENPMPVVVNEIAWGGTQAHSTDEWIELYNRTPYPVSLEGWSIHTDTYDVAIPLSGTIDAQSYFLIEKKDEADTDEATQSPVVDVIADLWVSWSTSLDNDGRTLSLKDAHGTVIDEITECGFRWCAGTSTGYTMERIRADITDDSINWRTASTYWQRGIDTNGNKIRGTPKAENGAPHIVSGIYADTILTSNGSPYIIEGTVTVPTGTTLTIEPGVVIKFATTTTQLIIQGTLRAEGTSESPIVFTAYTDDTYGGDTNNDASATSPTPGSWHSVQVASGGTFSAEHTTIRYGGRRASGQSHHGMVRVQDGGSITLSDSTLEHAQEEALWIDAGATTDIQHSTFKNNADASFGYGVYAFAYGSDAFSIKNSTFESNGRTGLFVDGDAMYTITDNTFLNNASAVEIASFVGALSNNSGTGNTQNGIVLPSTLGVSGTSITLTTNPLPFLLTQSTTIPTGAEVHLGAGTIYASANTQLTVEGTLNANGTIFSTENQAPGLPAQAGSWRGILVQNDGAFSANGITLEYAGGDVFMSDEGAGLVLMGASSSATLTNSTIQHNKQTGVRIDDGALSITDSAIAHHIETRTGEAKGVWARGGATTLTNVTFSNNTIDSDVPSP